MTWNTPPTWVSGQPITSAFLNQLRDNLLETAPAKAATTGAYFTVTAPNVIAERKAVANSVIASESTTSTSYVDLTTFGPSVTCTASALVIVAVSAYVANNTVNAMSLMGVDISGSYTQAATNSFALRHTSATANAMVQASFVSAQNVTAGSSTYTGKYSVTTGTGNFDNRRITVIPF